MEIEKLDTRTLNNGTSMPIGKNFFRAKKIKKYGRMILSVIMVYMRLSDTVNIRVVLIARRLHISDFL